MLYISLRKPQRARDNDMEGRFISHHSGSELAGVTVFQAKGNAEASTG
jgi:hypothetical protein